MRTPRYARTGKARIVFTDNIHLIFWSGRVFNDGRGRGVTVKRRLRSDLWRHYGASVMVYASRERGMGTVRHFEIEHHDSRSAVGDRISYSKRYLRFKMCSNGRVPERPKGAAC